MAPPSLPLPHKGRGTERALLSAEHMTPAYTFRPMSPADLPLIRRWLGEVHVREWWGDPDEQFALVSGDLDEPAMDQFIVLAGTHPFGYLQCYRLTAWNTGSWAATGGTCGIDRFIRQAIPPRRAHGPAFIRQFVDGQLRAGPAAHRH